ncbi:hypothetical protein OU997_16175 [Pseudomonas sp. SL4(2022)]|uniref:hypothetical protein n=1 Tax=Pseudomonas sp. SL4(2022) TaxID=2994661 RepID=UPI002270B060|nr:hypothetical protein [Pseudomonas sp. SL4(2022)]WAC43772.1 hypothetical protein OU997_16175 [Pseudomonas sp. SL4(2022)]
MFFAALKPSFAKLGATVLIILTTMIYGVLNTALTKETSKQMNEAFLGEPLATKIKQISEAFPCERDQKIADISIELAEKNSGEMLSVRNKWLAANFLILLACAYLSACIILSKKTSRHAT